MLRRIEDFLNWQTDWDIGWGVMLFLRPPRNRPIGWRTAVLMYYLPCAFMIPAGILLVVASIAYARYTHGRLPSLGWMATIAPRYAALPAVQWGLACGVLTGFIGSSAYVWAWNRRARRLAAGGTTPGGADLTPMSGDWPPAPQNVVADTQPRDP